MGWREVVVEKEKRKGKLERYRELGRGRSTGCPQEKRRMGNGNRAKTLESGARWKGYPHSRTGKASGQERISMVRSDRALR